MTAGDMNDTQVSQIKEHYYLLIRVCAFLDPKNLDTVSSSTLNSFYLF